MAGMKAMKQSMFDKFEIKGYWWLPNTEEKVSGVLFYEKDNIRLELIGALNDFFEDTEEPSIILGISDKGEEFTLMNCFRLKSMMNAPGFSTETYHVELFLVGGCFDTADNIMFQSLLIYPTYFSEWASKSFISFKYEEQQLESIHLNEPKLFSEYVDSINTTIEETYSWNASGNRRDNVNLVYTRGFKIKPDEWKNFEWYRNIMFKTKELYTLFIGHPTYFENITFYGEEESLGNNETYKKKYSLFFEQKKVKMKKKFNWLDVMFSYKDITNLNQVFNLWFEKEDLLKTVVNLHISDFYIDSYLETKFLNAVQTLEIYHRKVFKGKIYDEAIYEDYRTKILEFVRNELPSDFYNKMEGMLKHGNEYSLSKRIRELINKNLESETKSYLFGNSDNRGKFVQQIVDTRNFLTHYDEGEKKNILKNIEIYYAIQRLKALTTLILFKEIGIDELTILKKVKDNKQFSFSIQKAKDILNKKGIDKIE